MSDTELKELVAQLLKTQEAAIKNQEAAIKSQEAAIRDMVETVKVTTKTVNATSISVGNLGGKIGVLVELLLVPGICPAMNKLGHNFVRVCPNTKVRKGKKEHTQIDLMLYNTTEAMAVEIKTHLDKEDVEWHIDKHLVAVRELEKEFGIEDKTLLGAVAGVTIDERARDYALKNGLYVIEIRENDNIPLKVESPLNNKPKMW